MAELVARMKAMASDFVSDDCGATAVEYVILAGSIALVLMAAIAALSGRATNFFGVLPLG